MFQNITNMNQFLVLEKLDTIWNQKKNEKLSPLDQMAKDSQKEASLNSITGKLMRGKKLSVKDKKFLKAHAPELLRKAEQAEAQREAYENELKSCRTKEDVERLHGQKLSMVMEANKGDNEATMIVAAAITDAKETFTKTSDYQKLPGNDGDKNKRSSNDNIKRQNNTTTNQKRYDVMEEMTESQQKLHFIMQNYSAQAQKMAEAENHAASVSTAELLSGPDTDDFAKSQGSVESARAYMQSVGIKMQNSQDNFVSFSSVMQPAGNGKTATAKSAPAPEGTAIVSRAHAAYQTAKETVVPTPGAVTEKAAHPLKSVKA